MGIFDRFPYSSTHEMNLDFMLGKATEIAESLQEIDTHKEQAEQAASNAAQSAQSAAQAAQAAAGSQTAASASAAAADQHKADAEDAADRAEAASNLADEAVEQAQTAATTAGTAAQNASTAAQNASTAADGAIANATAAETRINTLAASLPEDFTELNNEVNGIKNIEPDTFYNENQWEVGGINYESGNLVPTSSALRTKPINVINYQYFEISVDSGYDFNYAFYDSTNTPIYANGIIETSKRCFAKPTGATYLRVCIRRVSRENPTIADRMSVHIKAFCNLFFVKEAVATGTGNSVYKGDKIVLGEELPQKHLCGISVWKDYRSADISNLAEYKFHLNQSIALYGGYVFLFQDAGEVVISDYATSDIISTATLPVTESIHANGAQFSSIYYDDNDEFPLLFVSRSSTSPNIECLIFRVQRSNNAFSFSLINTIRPTIATYVTTYAVDAKRNILTIVYMIKPYTTPTDNKVIIKTYNMPSKAEIISGNTIRLEPNEAMMTTEFDYGAFQQCVLYDSKLFMGYQPNGGGVDGRTIHIFDAMSGKLINIVTMPDFHSELEGVYVYDSKLFVTQKKNTDSTGVNPLTIYQIEF